MRNHAKKESLAHTEVNYAHILYPPQDVEMPENPKPKLNDITLIGLK